MKTVSATWLHVVALTAYLICSPHPATARRLAWRICRTFLGEGVADQHAMDELADGLTANRLNIGWAVETVLRSKLFFSSLE